MPKPLSSCSKSTRQYILSTVSKYEAMEEVVAICKGMDFPIITQHSEDGEVYYACSHCYRQDWSSPGITHESDCVGMRLQSLLNEFTLQEAPDDREE